MKSFLIDRQRTREGPVPTESHPLSPPETEISSQLDHSTPLRRPSLAHPDSAYALPTIPATPDVGKETASARYRRIAAVQRSGSREFASRDFRGVSRPQTRWLVVLMPPPHLTKELAVGHRSPGRIANGLLLFAQLTAIAKEFSLPSTTGLGVYVHLVETGATPRVTDDIWPLLWSRHLNADESTVPLGLPVAGRVEFDIDVANARWYPMWFAHVSRQELVPDLARTIPTSPRALGRELLSPRAQPKSVPRPLALAPRDEPVVQVEASHSPAPSPGPSPLGVAIPKSASKETVEKVRRWSALVTPDPAPNSDLSVEPAVVTEQIIAPPSAEDSTIQLLSEDVPETEEPLNLEDFQWSITSAGPPSPTSSCATSASSRVISIHMLERNEGSVCLTPTTATSWGPPSVSDVESELNLNLGWRVRSPDIGERAEGSVLLTPSTATSWGAPLSYPPTPAQWIAMQELVRSPDLGERAEGSVLPTPSTATTWGAPLSYPPTPAQWYAMQQHVRSPDAGQRAEGSVLLTPSTATTWGAPETFPPTPEAWRNHIEGAAPSPDLGVRAEVEGEFDRSRHSTMVWSTEVETEEEAYRRMGIPHVWELGWPMMEDTVLETVEEEAQDHRIQEVEVEDTGPVLLVTRDTGLEFEDERVYEAGWSVPEHGEGDIPLDIEGSSALEEGHSVEFGVLGSDHGIDAFEYDAPQFNALPTDQEEEDTEEDDDHDAEADAFEYELPHFELVEGDENEREREDVGPDTVTPDVFEYSLPEYELQPSLAHMEHPALVKSPMTMITAQSAKAAIASASISVGSSTNVAQACSYGAYPFLVIYPAVYPHLDLYPPIPAAVLSVRRLAANLQTSDLTKSINGSAGSTPSPVESIKSISPPSRKPSLSVQVPRSRASTVVAVNPADGRSRAWSRALPPVPPVPREIIEQNKSLERTRSGSLEHARISSSESTSAARLGRMKRKPSVVFDDTEFELLPSEKKPTSSSAYPLRYPYNLTVLYPLGYPHNLEVLYPSIVKELTVPVISSTSASASTAKPSLVAKRSDVLQASHPVVRSNKMHEYPVFELYPAVYPYNLLELYPAVSAGTSASVRPVPAKPPQNSTARSELVSAPRVNGVQVRLRSQYPALELFPPVYPYNLERIYPVVASFGLEKATVSRNLVQGQTPLPKTVQSGCGPSTKTTVRLARVYPNIELYAPVYPFSLEIYPAKLAQHNALVSTSLQTIQVSAVGPAAQSIKLAPRARKTHSQLCIEAQRKTHAQLVAEVAAPLRTRKSHKQLQAEVFPDGSPDPVATGPATPDAMVTPMLSIPTEPEPEPATRPTTAPLRRQRSGTIMMRGPSGPSDSTPLPRVPSTSEGSDLSRSRSMIESRSQVFERSAAPSRSQTIGPPRPLRGKSPQFERAMSLFHGPEEANKATSEGATTPPRISRNVSKLDMTKFKFA